MFYRPEEGHGLPRTPFNAIVSPRPIGWISSRDGEGHDNLAPYSFFNAVAYTPPQVMFATTTGKPDRSRGKDSFANIEETGVFCVNIVSEALLEAMNVTSAASGREIDEFEAAGLEKVDCETIPCARVRAAPAALECRVTQLVELPGKANLVAFGEVVGIHIDDAFLKDGYLDVTGYRPAARLGYMDYSIVRDLVTLERPD